MGTRRVLIIDDSADCADSLRDVLDVLGYEVAVAYGGESGLALARRFRPDVVLCELAMPRMDGYAVARAMRADPQLRAVRLIAVTGHAQPREVHAARDAGFGAHLAKPGEIDRLVRLLED